MMIVLSVPCISIPINLKYGTAKGRIIYLIIVGIICGTMPALLLSDSGKLSAIMVKLFSNTAVLTAVSFAVLVAMILISWLISIKIYEAKEV